MLVPSHYLFNDDVMICFVVRWMVQQWRELPASLTSRLLFFAYTIHAHHASYSTQQSNFGESSRSTLPRDTSYLPKKYGTILRFENRLNCYNKPASERGCRKISTLSRSTIVIVDGPFFFCHLCHCHYNNNTPLPLTNTTCQLPLSQRNDDDCSSPS